MMVKRQVKAPETEPEKATYENPSEKEHLFQVVNVFDNSTDGNKFNLDLDTVLVKLEVVGGDENGRSLLNRLTLDPDHKGFFATRLFLKAINRPHKGDIEIDTDDWVGCQLYATVRHQPSKDGMKVYANIDQYNFDKIVESEPKPMPSTRPSDEEVAWDE